MAEDNNGKQKPDETTPDPDDGVIRPGNGNIRVLLVGINEYLQVKNLGGCIDDLNRVEGFLKKRFGISEEQPSLEAVNNPLHAFETPVEENVVEPIEKFVNTYPISKDGYGSLMICRLEDQKATYDNIIRGFREFLRPAGEPDRVWFHFSGHGTEAPTAEEFKNLEDGEDQCLICYDCTIDKETGQLRNLLADKELAVLLNEVTTGDNGTPHIVVTLDCCHSGGATREFKLGEELAEEGVNSRHESLKDLADRIDPEKKLSSKLLRPLSSYLNGHYADKNGERSTPIVPGSPHVVMTACNHLQLAGEKSGGYFTNGLIDALESVGGKISYADLQVRARAAVQKKRRSQTPQFDVIGGTKAYTRFLEGVPEGDPDKYEVKFFNGKWIIGCGAIHGLPTTATIQKIATSGKKPIEIEIFSFAEESHEEPVVKATITEVGPQFSKILELKKKEDQEQKSKLSSDNIYYGILNYFPAEPVFVKVSGSADDVQAFTGNWMEFRKIGAKSIHFLTEPDADETSSLEVKIGSDGYRIIDHEKHKMVDVLYNRSTPNEVLIDLIQIVNWRRFLALDNRDPNSTLKERISLNLTSLGKDDILIKTVNEQDQLQIIATESNSMQKSHEEQRLFNWIPKATIKSGAEGLYCYLFKLWSWYEIAADPKEDKSEIREFNKFSWGLENGEDQDTVYFKLIVTSNELDYHQLLQPGIFDGRGRPGQPIENNNGFKDWCAITLKVDVIREEAFVPTSE